MQQGNLKHARQQPMTEDIPQRDQNWFTFRERAVDAVRRGYEPEHISGYDDHLELQLLTLPAFGLTVGWQVYRRQPTIYRQHLVENDGLPRFIATRTVWKHEADVEKLYSPLKRLEYLNRLSPSLSFQAVEVEPRWIQEELDKLHNLVIPPFVETRSIGLDSVIYEICQGSYMTGTRLNWWGKGPEQWLPLGEIFVSLWTTLEELMGSD